MRGPLPSQLAEMQHLRQIVLSHNQFTGSIPGNWWTGVPKLQTLELISNQLSGSISSEVGLLLDIKDLALAKNRIVGT